ncbi:MAG: TetR/AcrR family transcriptional regulator [Mesorhizobium sp.]|uniref:TetR/AcrR family transcriptional regulator n=1 Tax=unclassified Mesorhizobium TaxID=325217 RepID=UPI000FCA5A94|nr:MULTISPECIES: TetR/AcrR family transcriptional regulator [unclassified Mesorhizobium]RUV66799.1 TetR/AcrR family transcriptional regulator [Mesorhizobium sp. M5C.F.Cr.IN.023.01.1.1]RWF90065.1 MAG: TetR/AcrR family transcriptional regulator [Mesorhizobium sp.]RWF92754.1 MAG: TetR/AcrR family transcriptional regulator [Mesorhizobium sp.]RWI41882.1 MAG: TetR/AcrR family transcriptional regulator [Mesorhizobium sp.]RWI51118.1 MAG: TetR/AcrR family transcriptional regulator [Mesorhizobium sp.]
MAGRPREFDRNQALEKARDAFWTRGYEGTSMADLVSVLGLASPRIYAAFGSKESLFREAVALYEANEGGFATRALAEEPTARRVIERMLREAVETYTRPGRPQGCMVVSAATNCAVENDNVLHWLAEHRLARTASIVERLKQGVRDGELQPGTDAETLGDYYATLMHGLSVQARDGVPKERLHALITVAMQSLDAKLSGKP